MTDIQPRLQFVCDTDLQAKLDAIVSYIESLVPTHEPLFPPSVMYPHWGDGSYNLSLTVTCCVALMHHMVKAGTFPQAYLSRYSSDYALLQRSGAAMKAIMLPESALDQLDTLYAYLEGQGVEIKPVSRKSKPNRRLPLVFAIFCAYDYVKGKQG